MRNSKGLFSDDVVLERLPVSYRLLTRLVPDEVKDQKGGLVPVKSAFHKTDSYTTFSSPRPISRVIPQQHES